MLTNEIIRGSVAIAFLALPKTAMMVGATCVGGGTMIDWASVLGQWAGVAVALVVGMKIGQHREKKSKRKG